MSPNTSISRRAFLKRSLGGLGLAAAPALLTACSALVSSSEAPPAAAGPTLETKSAAVAGTVDVTLITAGWPLAPLPTRDEIAADRSRAGYAEALHSWLDANPGVAVEHVAANVWDQQAMVAAVAGGTAPTWIYAPALGGGTQAGARAAFAQGLLADITPAIEAYGLKARLTPAALAAWETLSAVDGKFFDYPIDAGLNGVIWYRRDLLAELGVAEPRADWSWADMRALIATLTSAPANRKGLSVPTTYLANLLDMHGWSLLTQLPTPETDWNWSYDFSAPLWSEVAAEYRRLNVLDQAIVASDDWITPWIEGVACLTTHNVTHAFGSAEQPHSPAALAGQLNKPYQDVIGFVPEPRGAGFFSSGYYVGGVAFNPRLTPEALDKAAGVLDYMLLGDGYVLQKVRQWEATESLQHVYNNPLPIDGKYALAGVNGTFADAWGERTLADLAAIAEIPPAPNRSLYFPAEANTGPSTAALDELWSTASLAASSVDFPAELARLQEALNREASGFRSSIDDATFVAAARAYYAALSDFWQAQAPEYFANTFKPWYESKVQPELG